MPIGHCEFCGGDIVAPGDVLVWAEDHTYHQRCYHSFLQQRITDEVAV